MSSESCGRRERLIEARSPRLDDPPADESLERAARLTTKAAHLDRLAYKPVHLKPLTAESFEPKERTY